MFEIEKSITNTLEFVRKLGKTFYLLLRKPYITFLTIRDQKTDGL